MKDRYEKLKIQLEEKDKELAAVHVSRNHEGYWVYQICTRSQFFFLDVSSQSCQRLAIGAMLLRPCQRDVLKKMNSLLSFMCVACHKEKAIKPI